jgi:hypothetical protein
MESYHIKEKMSSANGSFNRQEIMPQKLLYATNFMAVNSRQFLGQFQTFLAPKNGPKITKKQQKFRYFWAVFSVFFVIFSALLPATILGFLMVSWGRTR